jgi:hypothetical protein
MSRDRGATLPPDFTERSKKVCAQYQREHDVVPLRGQVAAVEPVSGRVRLGEDALEAVEAMNAEGVDAPVWSVRIGFSYLDVKGRR